MNVRYRVELSQSERAELMQLMSGGKHAARKLKRTQILLAANVGVSDEDIAASVGVGGSMVYRTKRRFVAMLNAPASNGCSQPKKPAPKWAPQAGATIDPASFRANRLWPIPAARRLPRQVVVLLQPSKTI
jgi:Homeodomain-like domain